MKLTLKAFVKNSAYNMKKILNFFQSSPEVKVYLDNGEDGRNYWCVVWPREQYWDYPHFCFNTRHLINTHFLLPPEINFIGGEINSAIRELISQINNGDLTKLQELLDNIIVLSTLIDSFKTKANLKKADFSTIGMSIIKFFEGKKIHSKWEGTTDGGMEEIYSFNEDWYLILKGNYIYLRFNYRRGYKEDPDGNLSISFIGSQLQIQLEELLRELNEGNLEVLPEVYSSFEGLSKLWKPKP